MSDTMQNDPARFEYWAEEKRLLLEEKRQLREKERLLLEKERQLREEKLRSIATLPVVARESKSCLVSNSCVCVFHITITIQSVQSYVPPCAVWLLPSVLYTVHSLITHEC